MVSKLITYSETREDAIKKMSSALSEYVVLGVRTNIGFLIRVMQEEEFNQAKIDTGYIERHPELLTEESPDVDPALIAAAVTLEHAVPETANGSGKSAESNWKLMARRLGVSRNPLI